MVFSLILITAVYIIYSLLRERVEVRYSDNISKALLFVIPAFSFFRLEMDLPLNTASLEVGTLFYAVMIFMMEILFYIKKRHSLSQGVAFFIVSSAIACSLAETKYIYFVLAIALIGLLLSLRQMTGVRNGYLKVLILSGISFLLLNSKISLVFYNFPINPVWAIALLLAFLSALIGRYSLDELNTSKQAMLNSFLVSRVLFICFCSVISNLAPALEDLSPVWIFGLVLVAALRPMPRSNYIPTSLPWVFSLLLSLTGYFEFALGVLFLETCLILFSDEMALRNESKIFFKGAVSLLALTNLFLLFENLGLDNLWVSLFTTLILFILWFEYRKLQRSQLGFEFNLLKDSLVVAPFILLFIGSASL